MPEPFNRYLYTPRKVFDKFSDRIEVRRRRDREDHRSDMAALIGRISSLERVVDRHINHSKKLYPNEDTCICTDNNCKYCTEELE